MKSYIKRTSAETSVDGKWKYGILIQPHGKLIKNVETNNYIKILIPIPK